MPFIMLTVLIDMLAIGIIIPVLPSIIGRFTQSPAEQAWWYGAAGFAFGMANFLASPLLGALSDQHGRRPVLLLGFLGLALSFFGTAAAVGLWMLVLVRAIGGAMQSNMAIANAYVADITTPEERTRQFGMLGAMMGVGFIFGPVLGGLLGAVNLQLPFVVAGSLALVNLAYGWWVLPESLPPGRRKKIARSALNPLASLRDLTQLRGVGLLVGVVSFSSLAQFMLYTSWVLYNTYKFGWGPKENGASLAVVGIVTVVVQGLLLGHLLRWLGAPRLVIFGLLSSALSYLAWGLATEGWMMYGIIALNVLGATVSSGVQSLISAAADGGSQGKTLGAVSALNSLAAVVAPLIAAPLLAMVSHLPRGDWRIGSVFYFCALLQTVSLWLAWKHLRRHGRSTAS